jgi:hypothetical protein
MFYLACFSDAFPIPSVNLQTCIFLLYDGRVLCQLRWAFRAPLCMNLQFGLHFLHHNYFFLLKLMSYTFSFPFSIKLIEYEIKKKKKKKKKKKN